MNNNPQVFVAGCNVDCDALRDLKTTATGEEMLTPETISAAYARISRDPRPVDELRREARKELERSRKSNRTIVFEMGHSSIAEHAVFNLDIIGVSRLLAEDIEKFRLVSYTEKSQRYVLLNGDYVLPEEVSLAGLEAPFREIITRQNTLYHLLYTKLRDLIFQKHPTRASKENTRTVLEGLAKEDARYLLALATETQLGMTINARNLELMIRRLAANPLQEGRVLAERIYRAAHPVAPSLIRYTEPTNFDRLTREDLAEICGPLTRTDPEPPRSPAAEVTLFSTDPQGDNLLLAALLHSSAGSSMAECLSRAETMDSAARIALVKASFRHSQFYDPPLREFEFPSLLFELTVSASCFAQLKRHRMMTITSQSYDPGLGVTVPPAIIEAGLAQLFGETIKATEEVYERFRRVCPTAAAYVLTNAHRRRLVVKLNARELYHLARIRADGHAQWEVRQVVETMLKEARKSLPLTMLLATGKDDFARLYQEVYG